MHFNDFYKDRFMFIAQQSDCLGVLMGAFSEAVEIKTKIRDSVIGLVVPRLLTEKKWCLASNTHTNSHTQTKSTNVSHILTNSDNREHSSCVYNKGAQQLFIVATFVTRVISIFG